MATLSRRFFQLSKTPSQARFFSQKAEQSQKSLMRGDKKPEMEDFDTVEEFFEEYLQFQPEKEGVVHLLPQVFTQMSLACKTEADLQFMNSALNDFIGHKNLLESHHIEPLFEKALEMK